jgi:hypothetical protein
MAGVNGVPIRGRIMVVNLKLPTLGIPAFSGAGGCQSVESGPLTAMIGVRISVGALHPGFFSKRSLRLKNPLSPG